MKKIDLIHTSILIVAILAGYTAIQTIISALSFIGFYRGDGLALLRTMNVNKDTLAVDLLRVTIGALLIYASPTLTNFIESTIAVRLNIKENKQEE